MATCRTVNGFRIESGVKIPKVNLAGAGRPRRVFHSGEVFGYKKYHAAKSMEYRARRNGYMVDFVTKELSGNKMYFVKITGVARKGGYRLFW